MLESTDEMRIWKWYQKSARIIGAYRDGMTYGTEEFRHRHIKARDNFKSFGASIPRQQPTIKSLTL